MNETNNEIAARILPYITERLRDKLSNREVHALRRVEPLRGCVMFFDLVDFSVLTDAVAQSGTQATEILSRKLSEVYTSILETVLSYGGTAYQFAGDSILFGFIDNESESPHDAVMRGVQCGLGVLERLSSLPPLELKDRPFVFAGKIGLAYGDYFSVLLGTGRSFYNPLLLGAPVAQAVDAQKLARGGMVVLDSSALEKTEGKVTGSPIGERSFHAEICPFVNHELSGFRPLPTPPNNDRFLKTCSRFIPPQLLEKISESHQGFLGDFRQVTCLFVRFECEHAADNLQRLVASLNLFHEHIHQLSQQYGGSFLHADLTDKGNVFLILFGAPIAQENREILAVRLAHLLLNETSPVQGIRVLQCGITSGQAYCGDVGASFRKGYTVVGPVINFAARLMTYGEDGGLYIDSATESKVRKNYVRRTIENVNLKGQKTPATIYRIDSEIERFRGILLKYTQDPLIGRRKEFEIMRNALSKACDESGQVCIVLGEAGIGKSKIAGKLLDELPEFNAEPLIGYCYSYEKYTAFFPWRELLLLFFQIFDFEDHEEKVRKLQKEFQQLDDVRPEWLPVLANMLGISLPETELTRVLDARQKNDRLFEIIFQLIERRAASTPIVIYFEDFHWADELSVKLVRYIAQHISRIPALLLIATRPDADLSHLDNLPNSHVIHLNEMEFDEAREFLRMKLKLAEPNERLEELILARSPGNPFFLESIAQSMIEQGVIEMNGDGHYKLKAELNTIQIPGTLQDVVLSRIDRLDQSQQTILKTASVIGRIFSLETLQQLAPETVTSQVSPAMTVLQKLDLTPLETESPITYIFKHIVIRDVAYNTLLVSTRAELHRRLAHHLEQQHGDDLFNLSDILAYHYLEGHEFEKALHFTVISARKARSQYANREAIYHYSRALETLSRPEFAAKHDIYYELRGEMAEAYRLEGAYDRAIEEYKVCLAGDADAERKIAMHIGLGQVYQERGEWTAAIAELETALRLLRKPAPRAKLLTILSILKQAGTWAAYSKFPAIIRKPAENERSRYRRQAAILDTLGKIYFWVDLEKLVWSSILSRNIADRLQDPEWLARAYSNTGALQMGLSLLDRAEATFQRSVAYGKDSGNPLAHGFTLSSYAGLSLFKNDPEAGAARADQAVKLFRQFGDKWGLLLSLVSKGLLHYYGSDFRNTIVYFEEMRRLAEEMDSKQHLGWALGRIPFCYYLLGEGSVDEHREVMRTGLQYSTEAGDVAGQITALLLLTRIAIIENQTDALADLARKTYDLVKSYKIVIPHVQIAFVDAGDAALNAYFASRDANLLKLARMCSRDGSKVGKSIRYIRGPALRLEARLAHALSAKDAPAKFKKALEALENSPNRWETGQAYADAAFAMPERRADYLERARKIFQETGVMAELRALERRVRENPI